MSDNERKALKALFVVAALASALSYGGEYASQSYASQSPDDFDLFADDEEKENENG